MKMGPPLCVAFLPLGLNHISTVLARRTWLTLRVGVEFRCHARNAWMCF